MAGGRPWLPMMSKSRHNKHIPDEASTLRWCIAAKRKVFRGLRRHIVRTGSIRSQALHKQLQTAFMQLQLFLECIHSDSIRVVLDKRSDISVITTEKATTFH
jgi:hypothetical protein